MNSGKNETDITFYDQIKKFVIKNMLGFQTVLLFGLGRRVSIFDYLNQKAKRSPNLFLGSEKMMDFIPFSRKNSY